MLRSTSELETKKLASKPWITKGNLIFVRKKNAVFRTHFIKGNLAEKTFFRLYSIPLLEPKPYPKRFIFISDLHATKRIRAKHG